MDILPIEVIKEIIEYLDILSLNSIKQCNTEFKNIVMNSTKIKWIITIPKICRGNRWTLMMCIKHHRLDYFKWCIESELEYDIYMSLYACKLKRIDFLNYIHKELKYPYDKRILSIAVRDLHFDVIRWCFKAHYKWINVDLNIEEECIQNYVKETMLREWGSNIPE